MYLLERQQRVAADRQEAWDFLQHPANLDRITPPDLRFRIVNEIPETMIEGLIVEYRITIPLIGTHAWITEIKHIRPGISFVDEQRLGPYRFWYHYHEIQEDAAGVLLIDRVHYQPPFGLAGRLLHPWYIRPTLERIFDFRCEELARILGAPASHASAAPVHREAGDKGRPAAPVMAPSSAANET